MNVHVHGGHEELGMDLTLVWGIFVDSYARQNVAAAFVFMWELINAEIAGG